jgi:hypothetical protein
LPWTLAGLAAGVFLAVAAMVWGGGPGRPGEVAQVTYPLSPHPSPPQEPEAAATVDPLLIEDGPFGPLPRIGADGRRPLDVYGHPFEPRQDRPRIAVLVIGLGLQAEVTDRALTLPAAISLLFSPYAGDLGGWIGGGSAPRPQGVGGVPCLTLPPPPPPRP